MKWLLENKFPYEWTFVDAEKNGNLENMKWLLENNFPYDEWTFYNATKNGNIENMKWLLEKKFPYDNDLREKLKRLKLLN
jgi:hypothetical protein